MREFIITETAKVGAFILVRGRNAATGEVCTVRLLDDEGCQALMYESMKYTSQTVEVPCAA